jgi:hypothetical protein
VITACAPTPRGIDLAGTKPSPSREAMETTPGEPALRKVTNSEAAAHLNRICSHERGCNAYSSHKPKDDFHSNSPAHAVDVTES